MAARDYSLPPIAKLVSINAKEQPLGRISSRRRLRMQGMTDLYDHLYPKHDHPHCSREYEQEDRSKPSISSF